ncbi:hypothetical protein BDR26DRAFT_860376 [Obelidium mucronatum]|nr:hypothetical protein BDR26DRAFT_860376 [Obelidium mucronatum]
MTQSPANNSRSRLPSESSDLNSALNREIDALNETLDPMSPLPNSAEFAGESPKKLDVERPPPSPQKEVSTKPTVKLSTNTKKGKDKEASATSASNSNSSSNKRRKSSRVCVPPMDFWKGERVEYKLSTDKETGVRVPHIENVPAKAVGLTQNKKNESSKHSRRRSKIDSSEDDDGANESDSGDEVAKGIVFIESSDSELEDDAVIGTGPISLSVVDALTGQEDMMPVVFGPKDINPQPFDNISLHRTFILDDYCGAGFMDIPVGGEKPVKNSGSTSVIFYVISGQVKVHLNKKQLSIGTRVAFHGNLYKVANVGGKVSRVYFVQVRGPVVADPENNK